MMKGTEGIVRGIIGNMLNVEPEDIGMKIELGSLGLDSLDAMAIAMDIENAFSIDIPDGVPMSKDWTIAEIVDYINSNSK